MYDDVPIRSDLTSFSKYLLYRKRSGVQKSSTPIGSEMNANLSYYSEGVQTPAERS